jgi:hypothetical protein
MKMINMLRALKTNMMKMTKNDEYAEVDELDETHSIDDDDIQLDETHSIETHSIEDIQEAH